MSSKRDKELEELKVVRTKVIKELRRVHRQLARGQRFHGNVIDILDGLIAIHEVRERIRNSAKRRNK
jgi:hypothetical protein